MTNSISAREKLARRICWLGWPRTPKEYTEATYWRSLPPETRRSYIEEAELFLSNTRSIRRTTSSLALLSEAIRERERQIDAARDRRDSEAKLSA